MGTAVEEPQTTIAAEAEPSAEAERSRQDLFEYSRWLNVGIGADQCEKARDGCDDPQHFHAWIRLPNPFQIRDIAEKAKAAQARRKRLLKNPESDGYVVLEAGLDELRDEAMRPLMIDSLLAENFHEVYQDAISEVQDREDPDATPDETTGEVAKLYDHIEQDREEFARLSELPEDQRDEDEYNALEQRIADYSRDLDKEIERLQEPKRRTLEEKSTDELVDMMRTRRVDEQSQEEYLSTFNTWEWYVCTYKPVSKGVPRERYFSDISELKFNALPGVVEALRVNFRDLEIKLARSRGLGNF